MAIKCRREIGNHYKIRSNNESHNRAISVKIYTAFTMRKYVSGYLIKVRFRDDVEFTQKVKRIQTRSHIKYRYNDATLLNI